ncbi:MAG TPA: hypothetical protein PKL83_02960, partial [bacterium]|nr:hypothetical protein [bacterium]
MKFSRTRTTGLFLFVLGCCLSYWLRFWLATFGSNYDFESYTIVGDIVRAGGTVYSETTRYNYGPWFAQLLGWFAQLASGTILPLVVFRMLIITTLTLADVFIAGVIWKRYSLGKALLYLLNPVLLLIGGYHNQFDNLALAFGLAAVILLESNRDNANFRWQDSVGLVLLGISLIIKHVLFLYPVWLFFSQKSLRKKIVYLCVPIGIFLASFIPYWSTGKAGIIENVFLYESKANFPFWRLLRVLGREILGLQLPDLSPYALLVSSCLILAVGYSVRHKKIADSFCWYLLSVVLFAPAIANQYLAIPILALTVYCGFWPLLYSGFVTFFLVMHPDGLGLISKLGTQYSRYRFELYGYTLVVFL